MIQIIGAGAIGCLWLAKLHQSGYPCHLVSRPSTKCLQQQLYFTDLQGQQHQFAISHSQQLLTAKVDEQQSTILVCVKAPQVLSALLNQQQYISPHQVIILMHNGYGCAEEVKQHFPENSIICATTANASLLNSPLNVTHTGIGPSYFGVFQSTDKLTIIDNNLKQYLEPLQNVMADVYWTEKILEKCWLKLIINAAINPLTAIHQITNGQLQASQYEALIQPLVLEAFGIAEAERIDFELTELQQTVSNVITATAGNYSSMNRDIFYGRETEIEYINGYLIKKAQQHNIATPILSDLYQQIKVLENR
ncbi:ketopantoate reductase family protein [Psychromonas sp. L1A2]|uniref:ketopantoate reductase family protein n=1 Tax=Psychromonas sp. L1A2 TaxID=2686356 RepID=UPI0013578B33|nr:2-dehydropantoate 2-reductase [Psychromonas sp. L1A2]